MNMTDELAMLISKGDVAFLQTLRFRLRFENFKIQIWAC